MKKTSSSIFAAIAMATFLPLNAHAGAESGVYFGGGLGDTSIEGTPDVNGQDFNATGYKLTLGYNFGVVPLVDLAVEGSYVSLGKASAGSVDLEQTSWNGFGLAGLSFGPLGLFAKVGMAAWDAEVRAGGLTGAIKIDDSGTDPVYGVGARLQFGSLTARIEYEIYNQSSFDDVTMASASLLYTF